MNLLVEILQKFISNRLHVNKEKMTCQTLKPPGAHLGIMPDMITLKMAPKDAPYKKKLEKSYL